MDTDVSLWVRRAGIHLSSARALLDVGNFLDVYFHCQQALELLLKGLYVDRHGELAPRLHSLAVVAEAIPVEVPEQYVSLLDRLTKLYVGTRYDPSQFSDIDDRTNAADVMTQTEEAFAWLRAQLSLKSD